MNCNEMEQQDLRNTMGISMQELRKCEVIKSEALEESIKILEKMVYQRKNANANANASLEDEQNQEQRRTTEKKFSFSTCTLCKSLIPSRKGKDYNCKVCGLTFCLKHRPELNHKCEKISRDIEKYLTAKSQFKIRLREIKTKAGR